MNDTLIVTTFVLLDDLMQWHGHRKAPTGRRAGRPIGAKDTKPRKPSPKHANLPAPTYDLAQCLPTGATRYGDKAYHSGEDEAWLDGEWGVRLVPICQKNMTPNSEPERNVLRHQRAVIEGVNSPLAAWGVQRLHARTSEGFAIKLLASLLALVVVNAR